MGGESVEQRPQNFVSGLQDFGFVITFFSVYHYISHLSGITVKLQSTSVEVIQAFSIIDKVERLYVPLREPLMQLFIPPTNMQSGFYTTNQHKTGFLVKLV